MKTFSLTIDVEPDATHGSWSTSNPVTFKGVFEGIPKIQSVANEFDVPVTYFVQPVVLLSDECVEFLLSLGGLNELASHLHGEYIGPKARFPGPDFGGCDPSEKQRDYPPDIEKLKLRNLTDLFAAKFGYEPKSFRAGRFGAGPNTCKFLKELGYSHDSSVTPRSKLYRSLAETDPYLSDGIIEVPVTINSNRQWLRPSPTYSSYEEMKSIIDWVDLEKTHACCMFHNVEVVPNISPYCDSLKECEDMLDRLRRLLDLISKRGYRSVCLEEVQC